MNVNNRDCPRFSVSLPIALSFGSQITLKGMLKDISEKSAFILVKSGIHMSINDELTFKLENMPGFGEKIIEGEARISRLSPGEGIAIYFTKMSESSIKILDGLINTLKQQ